MSSNCCCCCCCCCRTHLLLVGNIVLRARNHAGILDTFDRLIDSDSGQGRIWREAFPDTTSRCVSAQRTDGWAQLHINSLAFVLACHGIATPVVQVAAPCGCDRLTGRKSADKVCESHAQGRVLETERFEAESGDRSSVADALFSFPSDSSREVDLLEQ